MFISRARTDVTPWTLIRADPEGAVRQIADPNVQAAAHVDELVEQQGRPY